MGRRMPSFRFYLRRGRSLGLVIMLCPLIAAAQHPPELSIAERRVACMGTWAWARAACGDPDTARRAAGAMIAAMEAAGAELSTWRRDTTLARLNAAPVGRAVEVGPRVARELARTVELWRETGGAFNPAMGPLVGAWGLRTLPRTPSGRELEAALAACDPGTLRLRGEWASRLYPGLRLEEGAWGKGAALDRALAAVHDMGCSEVQAGLGGQVAWRGGHLELEVAHPRRRGRVAGRLRLPPGSVATSGDGVRPGHLLDPATGRPARDFGSVTVWTASALDADALATALFVMGPVRGLRWAEDHPGVEALVLVAGDGTELGVMASSGLRGRWSQESGIDHDAGREDRPARKGGRE